MELTSLFRYGIGVLTGLLMTGLLFYIMQAVIQSDKNPLNEASNIRIMDIVRVLEDQAVQVKDLKPEPPPPPSEPPPDMPQPQFDTNADQGIAISTDAPDISVDLSGGGFSGDGEQLPIVKVEPVYPRRAQTRGIEGFVLVEFCLTTTGTVRDPFVVDAEPSSIFDRAALNATMKWKYKPKIENDVPVEVCGVRTNIVFELEDE